MCSLLHMAPNLLHMTPNLLHMALTFLLMVLGFLLMVHLLLRPAAVQAMLDESRVKSEGGASGSPDKVAAAGSNVNERSLSAADGGPIMHSSTTTRQTNPLFSGSPRDGGRGSLASQLQ